MKTMTHATIWHICYLVLLLHNKCWECSPCSSGLTHYNWSRSIVDVFLKCGGNLYEQWKVRQLSRILTEVCIKRMELIYNQWYVEIKCQLDATDVFIADLIACSTCFRHHYAHQQELESIIQPANRTHNPQLHTIPTTWKPKHQVPQAATICIILSSSWWWA
jgi:hypothetical protein